MAYYFPRARPSSTARPLRPQRPSPPSPTLTRCGHLHGTRHQRRILFNSGWEDATDTVFKVEVVDVNSFRILA